MGLSRTESFKRDPDKAFILQYAPIFSDLTLPEKNLIFQKSKVVEYKKGDIIYRQHDSPDAFYCLVSGRVKISSEARILEYLNCAKYFGIISLLTGEPHSVDAEAVNDSKVLRIAKEDFQIILNKIPKLAIDLSRTLSRRLKKKDVLEKRIFESNIISIFSVIPGIGCTTYALNLGLSLKRETHKNVILIDVSKGESPICRALEIKGEDKVIEPSAWRTIDEIIKSDIYTHNLNAFLTYLTSSYHYIIVDLPKAMDALVFQTLDQSDLIHIITDYDTPNLEITKSLLSDLLQKVVSGQKKIKVIVNLRQEALRLSDEQASKLLNYKVTATLPEMDKGEYSQVMKLLAREIGDVRVGLALSGGAAYGLAQIGVIKVLEEEHIPIDMLVGSSMGALLGALWASGLNSQQLQEIALDYNNNKKKVFYLLMDPCFPRLSFMKGRRIRAFLEKNLGNKTFQDTRLPFKVVTYNLTRRQELILESGRLTDAVMASIAIPGIFYPTRINGDLLVDGGIVESVPIGVLVKLGIKKSLQLIPYPVQKILPLEIIPSINTDFFIPTSWMLLLIASRPWST